MKSIDNLPQLKYKQRFPNKDHKKSPTGVWTGVIIPTNLGSLSCGRFISWRTFVHLSEE